MILDNLILIFAFVKSLGLCVKELFKTDLAVFQKFLSKLTILDSLDSGFLTSETEFNSNNLLAQITIESAILLFVLSLSENGFHNDSQIFLIQGCLCNGILSLIMSLLILSFKPREHISFQFYELFVKIVRENNVSNTSDLLLNSFFLVLKLFHVLLTLFSQLLLFFVDLSSHNHLLFSWRLIRMLLLLASVESSIIIVLVMMSSSVTSSSTSERFQGCTRDIGA